MFRPVMMVLQTQSGAGIDADPFYLKAFISIDDLIPTPGTMHFEVCIVLGPALTLEPLYKILDISRTIFSSDQYSVIGGDNYDVGHANSS